MRKYNLYVAEYERQRTPFGKIARGFIESVDQRDLKTNKTKYRKRVTSLRTTSFYSRN